jgi:hypothetical protein
MEFGKGRKDCLKIFQLVAQTRVSQQICGFWLCATLAYSSAEENAAELKINSALLALAEK